MKQQLPDDWRQYVKKQMAQAMGQAIAVVIGLAICLIISMCMSGCKTASTASYRQVKQDTIYIYKSAETNRASIVKDSTHVKDSIYTSVLVRNDTVYMATDRWYTKYQKIKVKDTIHVTVTDTIYKSRNDSSHVAEKGGVVKNVTVKSGVSGLSAFQRLVYGIGWFFFGLIFIGLLGWLGVWVAYKYKQWKDGKL
jgi:hypothetical protein